MKNNIFVGNTFLDLFHQQIWLVVWLQEIHAHGVDETKIRKQCGLDNIPQIGQQRSVLMHKLGDFDVAWAFALDEHDGCCHTVGGILDDTDVTIDQMIDQIRFAHATVAHDKNVPRFVVQGVSLIRSLAKRQWSIDAEF